ncbi:MAG: hypothetical protein HC904_13230 [Blastochloris sp.]|nr:hypothetical protein [Blastochloris sp.]
MTVHVSAGQKVKEGEELVTVEAMKMNTFVFAPRDGEVAKIAVAAGDGVEEGQLLVSLV